MNNEVAAEMRIGSVCGLFLLSVLMLYGCAVVDDLTTGNWTNWGCEGDMQSKHNYSPAAAKQFCDSNRSSTQQTWAKANNVAPDHSWSKDAAGKLTTLASNGNAFSGAAAGDGFDTSASCRGKGNCEFQMPAVPCGKYSPANYLRGYVIEQTNTCSFDIVYKLNIQKGPDFNPYGAHQMGPLLRPGQKAKGVIEFEKNVATRIIYNYSCRTFRDVTQLTGLKLQVGPNANKHTGCWYITSSDDVGVSK